MYTKLDNLISEYQYTIDFWYDYGCNEGREIITKFNESDWNELQHSLNNRSLEWKEKLVYILDTNCNIREIEILFLIMETESGELFISCIDTLRSFETKMILEYLHQNQKHDIINRIIKLSNKNGEASRKVLNNFLEYLRIIT